MFQVDPNETFGFIAGALTVIAFLPQVIRVVQAQSARDLPLFALVLYWLAAALWLVYGIAMTLVSVILMGGILLLLLSMVLLIKLRRAP